MIKVRRRKGDQVCRIDSLEISVLDITPTKVVFAFHDSSRRMGTPVLSAALVDLCRNRGGHFWFSSEGVASFVLNCQSGRELKLVGDGRLAIERIARGTSTIVFRDAALGRPSVTSSSPSSHLTSGNEKRRTRSRPYARSKLASSTFWGRLAAGLATLFVRL